MLSRWFDGYSQKMWLLLALFLFSIAVLGGCFAPRSVVTILHTPSIPTINEIVWFEAIEQSGATIYEWDWTFGDGATASGQRVWHAYQSVNVEEGMVAPWKVSVTAVDDRGNVSSAAQNVQVQPHSGHLATYARQEVGLDCIHRDQREPEIPSVARVISIGVSTLEEYWQIGSNQSAFLLLKLFRVPTEIEDIECRWSIFALGTDGLDSPQAIAESIDGGSKANYEEVLVECEDTPGLCWAIPEKWYWGYIGFSLEVNTTELPLTSGWYLVFASVASVDPTQLDRNVYSFRIHINN